MGLNFTSVINTQPRMIKIFSLLIASIFLLAASFPESANALVPDPDPVQEATFQILEKKCNVCHRKKNPFMVFKPKNMERRAEKIHQAVFVTKRMPKPKGTPLTQEEYQTLKTWLQAQNIHP
jgi:uncharacterized membrane protein